MHAALFTDQKNLDEASLLAGAHELALDEKVSVFIRAGCRSDSP